MQHIYIVCVHLVFNQPLASNKGCLLACCPDKLTAAFTAISDTSLLRGFSLSMLNSMCRMVAILRTWPRLLLSIPVCRIDFMLKMSIVYLTTIYINA